MKKMYDEAEFKAAAHSFSAWMTEQSLPLWWKKGRLANGSFCEALDFCGDAIDSDESRVRVQARQLFCFSLAWNQGWRDGISADELERSAARFCSSCLRSDGLAGLRTNIRNGELINDSLDLYDNAFALLALSQSHAALQTAESLARMKKMFHAIASGLANQSSGGFLENVPPGAVRLQNPHMHLFESLLLAYQASDDQEILDELRTLYDFVNRTFFDTEQALVAERVPEGSREAAQSFEPGHSMEWVWLLGYYARMTGSQLPAFAEALYLKVLGAGYRDGELPMELNRTNQAVDASRRLWAQTESLKAHLCIFEMGTKTLRDRAAAGAVACTHSMLEDWLGPALPGGWHDHFSEDGKLISPFMPASSGYHVYFSVAEFLRVAGISVTSHPN